MAEDGGARQPGGVGDQHHCGATEAEAEDRPDQGHRADLGRDREPDLRAARATLGEAACLVADPAL